MSLFEDEALEPAAPSGPLVRVRMTVAYDGTDFHGIAVQRDQRTVAGVLEAALAKVLQAPVTLTLAGRTDAGVHAWGQVVSFDAPEGSDLDAVPRRLNRMLGPEVVVRDVAAVDESFDARFSATGRRYRYTVLNRPVGDPFLARHSWHVPDALDVRSMQLACDPLFGEHDFASFCRKQGDASLVRRIDEAEWKDLGDGILRFDVGASSFCQQMVRSLVGTMVEVGLGKRRAGEMSSIVRARDRSAAGKVAPPTGLVLWEVCYG